MPPCNNFMASSTDAQQLIHHWLHAGDTTAHPQIDTTPFGCGVAFRYRSASFRGPEVVVRSSNHHSIEIKDTETGEIVICEAVDWTDEQRRFFIAQLLRLTGISAEPAGDEPEQDSRLPQ
jgi:hypothetical protein